MKFTGITNGRSCEYQMQDKMEEFLTGKAIFQREFYIPLIGRISDFICLKGNRLINIEAKSNVTSILVEQLIDHSRICDYCFAFIPDYAITPKWFKKELLERGFGLFVFSWEEKIIVEALEAHKLYNQGKKEKQRIIKILRETKNEQKQNSKKNTYKRCKSNR